MARELHNWTFSAESIAACTIHDVLNMRKNTVDNYDFFWLGRVPCRSAKIVGMVVGIQVYERKITYTVDDGSGVLDCVHSHRPKSPSKLKYRSIDTKTILEPFDPVVEIGQTIRVTGIVRLQYHTRIIFINEINQCASPNEELLHSRLVRELRRTNYSSKEPFVIPKRTDSLSKSSPIKELEIISCSPPKLRHPSRLHTSDLTENVFRIYVKHFMDNVKPHQEDRCISSQSPEVEGFTISYLRRVPELSLLAYRVVQAVATRRERDKTKRPKEGPSSSKPSPTSSATIIPSDKLAGKMKRLFGWAIIQLLQEGCIILWDGPVRSLPHSKSMVTDSNRLWKTKPSYDPASIADDKFFESNSRCLNDVPISGYISEPQPEEESYISLTPTYLSEHVVQAIQFLVEIQAAEEKPYAGATAQSILSVLKKDDRWRNIGLWNVQDALDILKDQGTIWDMGEGRWDLTA